MSWEDQGRQWHGWFGSGTSGGADAVAAALGADAVETVASGALGTLSGARRAEFARYLSRGGVSELSGLLPAWARGSGLGANAFRREVVGDALSLGAAEAAQRVGRAYALGDLAGAGSALADVVSEGGPAWRYGMRWARDLVGEIDSLSGVKDGSRGGPLPVGGDADRGVQLAQLVRRGLAGLGPMPRNFVPGTPEEQRRVHEDIRVLRMFWDWLFPALPSGPSGDSSPSVGQGEEKPQPRVSPSAGTGTPEPDHDPEDKQDTQTGKKDQGISQMEKETGISRQEFRDLAGFTRRLDDAATASTEASPDVIARLKARGVPREMIQAYKEFYKQTVVETGTRGNASAAHRAALLESILRSYP